MTNKQLDNLKNNCPDVHVKINRKVKLGRIVGIDHDYPTVYLIDHPETQFEVSWECIYRAHKTNKPITY